MPNASPRRGHLYETDAAHRDRTTRSVVQVDSIGGGVRRRVHRPDTADADSLAASHRRAVHAGPPCPRRHAPAPRLQRGDVSRGPPAARHGNANRDRIDMGRRPVRRGDCARHRGSKQPLLRVLRLRGAGGRVPGRLAAGDDGDRRECRPLPQPDRRIAPGGLALLHHAAGLSRHHRVSRRIPRRAADDPRIEDPRAGSSLSARTHRTVAARWVRAGPRWREPAAGDESRASATRAKRGSLRRAHGAPGGREPGARRAPGVHPLAGRSRAAPGAAHAGRGNPLLHSGAL